MTASLPYSVDTEADVCLILEGALPFLRGGVSTWAKQITEGLPELTFSIIVLGTGEGNFDSADYEIPKNVTHLEYHCLLKNCHEPVDSQRQWFRSNALTDSFDLNDKLHESLRGGQIDDATLSGFAQIMSGEDAITENDLQRHRLAWESICKQYEESTECLDFYDYFWTICRMHRPLFLLSEIADTIPLAKKYHSISTGYTGFLGALLKKKTGRPLLVSEHRILADDHTLDLAQLKWLPVDYDLSCIDLNDEVRRLSSVWLRFFNSLSRMTYTVSNEAITSHEANRLKQIRHGADENRLRIIPDGVAIEVYKNTRRPNDAPVLPVIGLFGPVVPSEDIKTFIQAMQLVKASVPDAQGWILGSEDENAIYTEECKALIASLDLEDVVIFKNFQTPSEIFSKLTLCVSTSVSGGASPIILDGLAAGIPAITTEVAKYSELIIGACPNDEAIGAAGAVVPPSNPVKFANAALELLNDKHAWEKASDAAVSRADTYYSEDQMINSYRDVYSTHGGEAQKIEPIKKVS